MPIESAGILMWRRQPTIELLLGHFGGPFWRNKDEGAWAIPKGLIEPGETAEEAARREFEEELGVKPEGPLMPIGRIRQSGGKFVEAFSLEGDLDPEKIVSGHYRQEWPPRSGRLQSFPEVDRAAWFDVAEARRKILPSQRPLIDSLLDLIG